MSQTIEKDADLSKFITTMLLILFSSQSMAGYKQCETIILAGHPDLPPISWGDYQSTLGAATEMTAAIFSDLGITVISDFFGSSNRVNRKLSDGTVGVNPAMISQPDNKDVIYIDPPVYSQSYVVITRRDKRHQIDSWNDLIKLNGVAPKNLSFGNEFDQFIKNNLNLVRTFNAKQGLKMLNVGRVDYAIYPQIQGDLFVSLLDYEGLFEKMPIEIATFDLNIGISKNIGCTLPVEAISLALKEKQDSGEAEQIINDKSVQMDGLRPSAKG